MSKKVPTTEKAMPFVTGGKWGVGINSRTSLQQAEVLNLLGRELRTVHGNLVEEGVPQHLAPLVQQLRKASEPWGRTIEGFAMTSASLRCTTRRIRRLVR